MNDRIVSVDELEACIGKTPGPMHLKVIDHLDDGARRWMAASPFGLIAFGDRDGIRITAAGGDAGFARVANPAQLELPYALLDEPTLARVGQGFGALFLVPGLGETLRVNGRVVATRHDAICLAVDECYVHCAKALIRSDFWNAAQRSDMPHDATGFLDASRFVAIGTIDDQGFADVSPKGDPGGAMIRLIENRAWYADRPGNRRVDSFRNLLTQPHMAAAVLIPGSIGIATLTGTARISTDPIMRARFAVEGKMPLLATCIEELRLEIRESPTLARAKLWPAAARVEHIDPAAMLVSHVKLNKTKGVQAALVRTALSVPGLMAHGLRSDYKNRLY